MGITYYPDLVQGSDEWLEARRGILTASEMKLIITPSNLKPAMNDKVRAHMYELLAQRVSGFIEPVYIGLNAERGHADEVWARIEYSKNYAETSDMGFITNDEFGFKIGYSPDFLVGDDGLGECKSRLQKYQVQTIIEHVATGSATIPSEYLIQCQTGLMVSRRDWLDFVSYCGGLPMVVIRVFPDAEVQQAIIDAAGKFESKLSELRSTYEDAFFHCEARLSQTIRRETEEMFT